MYKSTFFTSILLVASLLFTSRPASSLAVFRIDNLKGAAKLEMDVPLCYMRTSDGTLLDLSKTCGFIKPTICADSLGTPERDAVLSEFCVKNEKCALTSTCNAIPRSINAPPGVPAGMRLSNEVIASNS